MKKKRTLLWALLLTWNMVFALEIEPFSAQSDLTEVFNTNCLQMTQSQQMLKAYIMVGLKSNFEDPAGSLARAIPAYDKRFTAIREYFQSRLKDATAQKAFDEAQTIWDASRAILLAPPTQEKALELKANFSRMIPLLLQGSKPVAKGGLELLSLTGKLCRGPMKISIDYLLKLWGVPMKGYAKDIDSIIQGFHQHLVELEANPLNNDRTHTLLTQAKEGFRFFEMMYNSKSRYIPNLLSRKADDNFDIIRAIKKEYKKQIK